MSPAVTLVLSLFFIAFAWSPLVAALVFISGLISSWLLDPNDHTIGFGTYLARFVTLFLGLCAVHSVFDNVVVTAIAAAVVLILEFK